MEHHLWHFLLVSMAFSIGIYGIGGTSNSLRRVFGDHIIELKLFFIMHKKSWSVTISRYRCQ